MTYICIPRDGSGDVDVYPMGTDDEIEVAREALRAAGLASAPVYAGLPDGEGDSYQNGSVLFAAEIAARVADESDGGPDGD